MSWKWILWPAGIATVAALAWGGFSFYEISTVEAAPFIPSTLVKHGTVRFQVTARGELQGSKVESLIAPVTGGREMVINYLRQAGELVEPDDVVVKLDTTEQEYALREAEADLEEAEQQLIQAKAENEAKEEEARYALIHARAEVKLREADCRANDVVAELEARQNSLALEAAQDQLRKLEQDVNNRQATNAASIAIQEAARQKAKVKADTARRNIENMTVKAKTKGYVALMPNTASNGIMFYGMQLPQIQMGDTVRGGMRLVQIPDLDSWEATANISELDRGHLAVGNPVEIRVVALPGKVFHGKVSVIGGTSGPAWNRNFQCRVALEDPDSVLRPGMSVNMVITTGQVEDALWVPSQALFESDGKPFVYLFNGKNYQPADVKLVERSESQVVLTGLEEGQQVALSNPAEQAQARKKGNGVMDAAPKS